jgi:hypothetical protein
MQASDYVIAASLIVSLSSPALAQDAEPASSIENHWTAAGFVGANFGGETDLGDTDPSLEFGGQIGYLWAGAFGAEFLADFSPSFDMDNVFLLDSPSVNTYMLNLIAAIPLGDRDSYQPYVSGGFGAVSLSTDVFEDFDIDDEIDLDLDDLPPLTLENTIQGSHTGFGGNVGFGFMGFAEDIGFRADLRYYSAGNEPELENVDAAGNVDRGDNFAEALVSGLNFWRANVGIAFRW